jgi:hypothetical protein
LNADVPEGAKNCPDYGPTYIPPTSAWSKINYQLNCEDIYPAAGTVIQHDQIGDTWYDFQKNGSMGRMIAVTPAGYREDSWMYCNGVYPSVGRYIRANCEPPDGGWIGAVNADGGAPLNAGYSNQSHLHDGSSAIIYHRTGGTPVWYATLCVEDVVGSNNFTRKFDVPDYIAGSVWQSVWPKLEVQWDSASGRDYIHIVGTDNNTTGGMPVIVSYVRCYIKDGPTLLDTLICQCYNGGSAKTYKVVAGVNGGGSFSTISGFDSSCSITVVPVCSKVSRRVSVAWLRPANCNLSASHCDYLEDVCFIESMNSGEDWIDGTNWPPPHYNITNYGCGGTERGFSDLSACYDYQDSLHVVFVTTAFDSTNVGYYDWGKAYLHHWSKKTGIGLIASKTKQGGYPGAHNLVIAKMSISAQNPVYHPTGDSVYLYCIWTQFDSTDVSANEFANGDMFGSGSLDGGATWGGAFNLTNTRTPGCAPGTCLSEHWSSLAQNMYDGDLHIQYICDKDAGGAIQDTPSRWMDNPVMYLQLSAWDVNTNIQGRLEILSYPNWINPPLKVIPGGTRNVSFQIRNTGNGPLTYSVSDDDPCILANIPPTILLPGDIATVNIGLDGTGGCNNTFIDGNIIVTTDEPGPPLEYIPLKGVVSNDYYECPTDPETFDTLNNGVLSFYVNANSQEWIHDISTRPDTTYEVFYNGGPFVATTEVNDTLVGRYYGDNDQHTLAREKLYLNSMYDNFWLVYSWNISIHKLNPPVETKWWWFDILHENVFFKSSASDDLKHTVIKFVTAERHDPPIWWPSQPTFTGYEDTYLGMMMDMDCPYDTNAGQYARNIAGYDATNNIAWQKGRSNHGEHPAYDDYYAGMALIQGFQVGEGTLPWGTYNLRNDIYLYPQSPWGWMDGQFYQLAKGNILGVIQDPDSIVDRSQIVTARMIPVGNDPNAKTSFTLAETFGSTGLAELQSRVAAAREWVASKPLILCGDVTNDGIIDAGDIIYMINYLFKHGQSPAPLLRGDITGNGVIEAGDIVALINYLFKGYPVSTITCPGVW